MDYFVAWGRVSEDNVDASVLVLTHSTFKTTQRQDIPTNDFRPPLIQQTRSNDRFVTGQATPTMADLERRPYVPAKSLNTRFPVSLSNGLEETS